MTTGKANIFVSLPASSKSVNSILKGFGEKLKNYIFKSSIKENQSNIISLTEETDPQKLELESSKALAYNTFFDQICIFLRLNKRRAFSIKYLDSFKEKILRDRNSLFTQSENLEMLFLIDLIKEIRKLRQKIDKNQESIDNKFMEADINEMTCKLYNNLPEFIYYRLREEELEHECNEMAELKEKVKELYPDNPGAQENYLTLHGYYA